MSVQPFSAAARPVGEVMSDYSRLYPRARTGRLESDEVSLFAALSDSLKKTLTLEVITPEQGNTDLHTQLVGCDQVHDFGARTIDELKTYRLGFMDSNKSALALVNPHGENGVRDILAAIYIYWQNDGGGAIQDPRHLRGNVAEILQQKIWPEAAQSTQAAIFYSISTFNVLKGAGQMLINRMHEFLTEQTDPALVLSTLSPLRGFGEWLVDVRGSNHALDNACQTEVTLRAAALEYLLNNRDGVQLFHMGNGASIGDINLNANSANSKDHLLGHNVMINYIYSRDVDEVTANQNLYARACAAQRAGQRDEARAILTGMMAPHLREELVDAAKWVPRSRPSQPGWTP